MTVVKLKKSYFGSLEVLKREASVKALFESLELGVRNIGDFSKIEDIFNDKNWFNHFLSNADKHHSSGDLHELIYLMWRTFSNIRSDFSWSEAENISFAGEIETHSSSTLVSDKEEQSENSKLTNFPYTELQTALSEYAHSEREYISSTISLLRNVPDECFFFPTTIIIDG